MTGKFKAVFCKMLIVFTCWIIQNKFLPLQPFLENLTFINHLKKAS